MTTSQVLRQNLELALSKIYDKREAESIAKYYFIDKYDNQETEIVASQEIIKEDISRFLLHEPLQYITGKAYFFNRPFAVDKSVLIPRPETEELVAEVLNSLKNPHHSVPSILDIGCGCGCIGITLLLESKQEILVTSVDISKKALEIAKFNSDNYDVCMELKEIDFLDKKNWDILPAADIIVSNPPYISINERSEMQDNVLLHEPAIALFAEPPIVFYRAIADFIVYKNSKVVLFCECNPIQIDETIEIFSSMDFIDIRIVTDLQGKKRHLVATFHPNK